MRPMGSAQLCQASQEASHRHEHGCADAFGRPYTQNDIFCWTSEFMMPSGVCDAETYARALQSDMSMRWAEITNDTSFTIGTAPLPVPSQGAALLPETPNTLDVMQAQIHKLVILSQDSVVPVTMQVQRRVSSMGYELSSVPVVTKLWSIRVISTFMANCSHLCKNTKTRLKMRKHGKMATMLHQSW